MKVAFLGTPAFAVPSLERLVEAGHDVVLVVTQPDRPAGRGRELQAPPVKVAALRLGLDVFQPAQLVDTRGRPHPGPLPEGEGTPLEPPGEPPIALKHGV